MLSDAMDVPEREGNRRLSRREAIKLAGVTLAGLAAAAAGSAWYLRFVAPRALDVTLFDLRLSNLPGALDGLRIAHLSDLHASEIVEPEWIRHAVDAANEYLPDLACLTGDYVYRSASWATACAQELSHLESPGGRFAVLGNHDVWNGGDAIAGALQAAGIHVLRNQGLEVQVRDTAAWIIGVEDTGFGCLGGDGGWEDLREAYAPARQAANSVLAAIPAGVPSLLLVHNPDFMQWMTERPVDLALAGHTHGGQVVLPGIGPLVLPSCFGRTYARGLVQSPGGPVYVNRGVGLIEPAVRLNCPPEVAVITLRRE
jgi:hypothetical protein